jgi:hypothetical protein
MKKDEQGNFRNKGANDEGVSDTIIMGNQELKPTQLAYPFGTYVDDIYQNQSWSNREGGWF